MANTTNFGWETPDDTDLVKDGAAAMRTLGNAIDTSLVDLKGGTTGQVLSKASNTDLDYTWVTQDDANAIQNTIVDAKGDIITATANDTPARLAVGSNGYTLVADSAASTGLNWSGNYNAGKNFLINGGMDNWQRSTSVASQSCTGNIAYYLTADRWALGCTSTVNLTSSRQTADTSNQLYGLRWGRVSGQTATGTVRKLQVLETQLSKTLAGQTVTLSFNAKKGADAPSTLTSYFYYGTGTDQASSTTFSGGWTGTTNVSQANTIGSTIASYSFTTTVPANTTQIAILFDYTATGTAGANEWFQLEKVQLELGSSVTTFSRAGGTIQQELAACQRYYWRSSSNALYSFTGATGYGSSGTLAYLFLQYPTMMRTTASSIDFSTIALYDGTNIAAVTALGVNDSSTSGMRFNATVASGLTQYRGYSLINNNSTNGFIAVSAEL